MLTPGLCGGIALAAAIFGYAVAIWIEVTVITPMTLTMLWSFFVFVALDWFGQRQVDRAAGSLQFHSIKKLHCSRQVLSFAPVCALGAIATLIDNRMVLGFSAERDFTLGVLFSVLFGLLLETRCGVGLGRSMLTVMIFVMLLNPIMWRMTIEPKSAGPTALMATAALAFLIAIVALGSLLTKANDQK